MVLTQTTIQNRSTIFQIFIFFILWLDVYITITHNLLWDLTFNPYLSLFLYSADFVCPEHIVSRNYSIFKEAARIFVRALFRRHPTSTSFSHLRSEKRAKQAHLCSEALCSAKYGDALAEKLYLFFWCWLTSTTISIRQTIYSSVVNILNLSCLAMHLSFLNKEIQQRNCKWKSSWRWWILSLPFTALR